MQTLRQTAMEQGVARSPTSKTVVLLFSSSCPWRQSDLTFHCSLSECREDAWSGVCLALELKNGHGRHGNAKSEVRGALWFLTCAVSPSIIASLGMQFWDSIPSCTPLFDKRGPARPLPPLQDVLYTSNPVQRSQANPSHNIRGAASAPALWSSGLSRVAGLLSWHHEPCEATPSQGSDGKVLGSSTHI